MDPAHNNMKMASEGKVILYIAASLDGYIAKPGDDLQFLSLVQAEGEDYGYAEFYKTVDAVIMGRKTFDWVTGEIGGLPHPDKETYIITRTGRPSVGNTRFFTGNLKELVVELKKQRGKNIYCDGGAEIVNALLKEKLIDEIILSVIPVLIGSGTKLFHDGRPEQELELIASRTYASGLSQLHYKVKAC
jgi:dihydrofolate reductase